MALTLGALIIALQQEQAVHGPDVPIEVSVRIGKRWYLGDLTHMLAPHEPGASLRLSGTPTDHTGD